MDEKDLKTSPKQRFFISLIAILMIGSMLASYVAVIIGNKNNSTTSSEGSISEEKLLEYENEYTTVISKIKEATAGDFKEFSAYRSEITAYNETSANTNGVQTRDLKTGTGRLLEEGDTNYLAYYIGWCADELVFDSSFDSDSDPTGIVSLVDANDEYGLIEGLNVGVVGMKLRGVREITVAGELAYKDERQLCGGYYKPLRFIIMPIEATDELRTLAAEARLAGEKLYWANYGIDYDAVMNAQ